MYLKVSSTIIRELSTKRRENMARIFDVIEYPNEMTDEIVHRFPEEGIGDYRIGSQVIVR